MQKIEIKKYVYRGLEPLHIPKRCDNQLCRQILPDKEFCAKKYVAGTRKVDSWYCDSWCREEANPVVTQLHLCRECGNDTDGYYAPNDYRGIKKGQIIRWRKVCSSCVAKKYIYINGGRVKIKTV